MDKIYLVSEETIKKHSLINNNLDGMYLLPTIDVVQNLSLNELLGPVLLNKITSMVGDNTISNPENVHYKELLDNHITNYMIWEVMSQIQISVNYKITNSGVIENNDDKKSRLDYATSRAVQSQYENYASSYALKMQNFITKHIQWYPEYRKCENFETSEDVNASGFFFPTDWDRTRYIGK